MSQPMVRMNLGVTSFRPGRMRRGVLLVTSKLTKLRLDRLGLTVAGAAIALSAWANPADKLDPADFSQRDIKKAFVNNVGQWDSQAKFMGRANGVDVWITKDEIRLDYYGREADAKASAAGHVVGMKFLGANSFKATGKKYRGVQDYVRRGMTNKRASKFDSVFLDEVYRGIDVVTYFEGDQPRYDFVVAPGADASKIKFDLKGANNVRVQGDQMEFGTAVGTKRQANLFAYQMVNGRKQKVSAKFKSFGGNKVGFELGAYDSTKELVIDPIVYGTYYGGDGGVDEVRAVTTDSRGRVFLAGYTKSPNYPVLYGPYSFNLSGGRDAFISLLQGDAYSHDYSALIGGSGDDQANFLGTDSYDNIWVSGYTNSLDFPGAAPGDPENRGWLMRFAPAVGVPPLTPFFAGNPVVFRFGGNNIDKVVTMQVEKRENVAAGTPTRIIFAGEATNPLDEITGAFGDGWYLTLNYTETGGFSVISTQSGYVSGGAGASLSLTGLSLDRQGNFVLSGTLVADGNSDTGDPNNTDPVFVTTDNVYPGGRLQRGAEIWVRKFSPQGAVIFSSLVGGSRNDFTEGTYPTPLVSLLGAVPAYLEDQAGSTVATDNDGNIYVLGRTDSFDFPRTRGVFGESFSGSNAWATVTKIAADGTSVLYSTHLNNGSRMTCAGIAIDVRGNAYITGLAHGLNTFPQTIPPADPEEPDSSGVESAIPIVNGVKTAPQTLPAQYMRANEGFLLILNENGTGLISSTYVGGPLDEGIFQPYADRNGDVWVYGWIDVARGYVRRSADGQTVNVRNWTDPNGTSDGFPAGFITGLAFKASPDPSGQEGDALTPFDFDGSLRLGLLFGDVGWGYGTLTRTGLNGFTLPVLGEFDPFGNRDGVWHRRDGFVLRFREALPVLTGVNFAPTLISGGDPTGGTSPTTTTCTVTLGTPALAGGARIELSLDTPGAASFNPTSAQSTIQVNIPAGATQVTVPVYSRPVTATTRVEVRADYAGNIRVGSFNVRPWLTSLTLSQNSIVGGNEILGSITLAENAPAPVTVVVSTDSVDDVSFPDGQNVVIAQGGTTATFRIQTRATVASKIAQINASLLGVTRTASLTINPPKLLRVTFNPGTIAALSNTTGTVELDGPAPVDTVVNLSVVGSPAGYTIPATVTIPANATSQTFTVGTAYEATTRIRTVAAEVRNGLVVVDGPITGTFTVQALSVTNFVLSPSTIPSGGTATGTITMNQPAPVGGAIVTVNSSDTTLASVPSTVVVPQGQTTVTFPITGGFSLVGNSVVNITVYRGPTPVDPLLQRTQPLTIQAATYSVSLNSSSVFGGDSVSGVVRLQAPSNVASLPGTLASNNAAATVTPTTFNFGLGQQEIPFTVNTSTVGTDTNATITATVGSLGPISVPLLVRAITVNEIELSRSTVRQLQRVRITVRTNAPVRAATTVALQLSNASLLEAIPPIVIPIGETSRTIEVRTRRVPRTLSTTITAYTGSAPTASSPSTKLTVRR